MLFFTATLLTFVVGSYKMMQSFHESRKIFFVTICMYFDRRPVVLDPVMSKFIRPILFISLSIFPFHILVLEQLREKRYSKTGFIIVILSSFHKIEFCFYHLPMPLGIIRLDVENICIFGELNYFSCKEQILHCSIHMKHDDQSRNLHGLCRKGSEELLTLLACSSLFCTSCSLASVINFLYPFYNTR